MPNVILEVMVIMYCPDAFINEISWFKPLSYGAPTYLLFSKIDLSLKQQMTALTLGNFPLQILALYLLIFINRPKYNTETSCKARR